MKDNDCDLAAWKSYFVAIRCYNFVLSLLCLACCYNDPCTWLNRSFHGIQPWWNQACHCIWKGTFVLLNMSLHYWFACLLVWRMFVYLFVCLFTCLYVCLSGHFCFYLFTCCCCCFSLCCFVCLSVFSFLFVNSRICLLLISVFHICHPQLHLYTFKFNLHLNQFIPEA